MRRNNDFLRAELLYIAHELSKKVNEEREGKKSMNKCVHVFL
jgi:hypothetical protein